eukprot:9654716-Lingulodinium_polyedra.AAC.1
MPHLQHRRNLSVGQECPRPAMNESSGEVIENLGTKPVLLERDWAPHKHLIAGGQLGRGGPNPKEFA